MSRAPSLLSGCNGKPEAYVPTRQAKCTRCEKGISKGESAAKIPTKSRGYASKKPYCLGCLSDVIEQTKKDLNEVEKILCDQGTQNG